MLETISYKGWKTCYRLANDSVELVITGDVGPRIIHFGFRDGPNEFYEDPATLGATGGDEWRIYGGHRLWHAPEVNPRTYWPDNVPVTVEEHEGFVRLIQPVEGSTGIQKQIDLILDPNVAHVTLVHRLINTNLWAVDLAPWALSVMAEGGRVIVPLPPRGSHTENLLPTNILTLWAYTDMADPRWTWATQHIMLQQQPGNAKPQKLGLWVPAGWVAYANHGNLFVKRFSPCDYLLYPDFGCNVEIFTNDVMLEVESLGPIAHLEPDCAVEHIEEWHLFADVPQLLTDADVQHAVWPLLQELGSS